MSTRRTLVVVLALACLAPLSDAGSSPEAAASKQLKAASKARLSQLKADLKLAELAWVGDLLEFRDTALAGQATSALVDVLFPATSELQAEVEEAVTTRTSQLTQDAVDALLDLQAALGDDPGLPDAFALGSAGALDAYAQGLQKLLDRMYGRMDKKLTAVRKVLAKQGLPFASRVRPPLGMPAVSLDAGGGLIRSDALSLDILLALHASEGGQEGALLCLGGQASPALGAVHCQVHSGLGQSVDSAFDWALPGPGRRWGGAVEGLSGFVLYPPGDYSVGVAQGTGSAVLWASLGLR